jgi:ribonuclease BN (tRNA processing enzyme)
MEPRIVFLGTGQGAEVIGKQLRGSGGIVIQTGEHQLHIDPGPGSLLMGRECNVNPRQTTALLISHAHLNHCNDVNCQIDAMTYAGLDKRGILIAGSQLIKGDEATQPYLTQHHKNLLEKYMVLDQGMRAAIDDVEITATTTRHSVESMGFRIVTPDFIVSYLGDTAYCAEFADEHKDTDILILNVVNPPGIKAKHNLDADDAAKVIAKLTPRLAIITHFSKKMLEADPLIQARTINKESKSQVIAAKDGMSINPLNYSRRTRQKRLKSF